MLHYEPKMELVGASFGWVASLARPDYILLALYGVTMLISFRLSAQPPTGQMDEMQKQMQIMTTWVMPIMLPFFMKGFSSAFILYWMSFNIVSMFFQYWMMKKSDPDRSIIKVLLGKTDAPAAAVEAVPAIPPRPKSAASLKSKNAAEKAATDTVKVTRVKSLSGEAASEAANGSGKYANGANGHANGNGAANSAGSITMEQPAASDGAETGSGDGGSDSGSNGNNGSAAQRARRRRRY
jgi:hypothetical protein